MMPSPPIHRRTDACHFARLSPGSAPACAGPQVWPVVAPQILSSNPRSARSRQYPRPSFEPRHRIAGLGSTSPTLTLTPNPHSPALAGCPTPRDFVPWRFSDAGLSSAWMVLCLPASENLHL